VPPNPKTLRLSEDKQAQILRASVDVFFEHGYRASMASVAAKAKVAKQTVYNYFGSKEKLFEAVVRQLAGNIVVTISDTDVTLRQGLINFGRALRERILSAEAIGLYRALVAEAPRFPKLARLIYATGPEAAQRALRDFLTQHMKRGTLCRADPEFAAQMLMNMLYGHERARLLYGVRTEHTRAGDRRRVEQIVACFLRAYAPESTKTTELALEEKKYASLH
jgi:TetR/AcrR family transcriptional regulator, mexJK operon transcriptional repressor